MHKKLLWIAFLWGAVLGLCLLQADTNTFRYVAVTNWVAPNQYHRVVSNQVYNVSQSKLWETYALPVNALVWVTGYKGGAGAPAELTARIGNYYHVAIRNYPYTPRDFGTSAFGTLAPARRLTMRLFPIGRWTNWNANGSVLAVSETFDYGLPASNKIPVVSWLKITNNIALNPQP